MSTYDVNQLHNDGKSLLNKIAKNADDKYTNPRDALSYITEEFRNNIRPLLRSVYDKRFGNVEVVVYALTDVDNNHEGWGACIVVLDEANFGRLLGTTVLDWNIRRYK